jgi:CubicO group peptidase (beta-lactamase class C family)
MTTHRHAVIACLVAGLISGHTLAADALAPEATTAFRAAVETAVKDRVIASGSWWIERQGQSSHGATGWQTKVPSAEQASEQTLFDVASLTKVIATTPCILRLIEQKKLALESPVATYLPEFTGLGREQITVRHLLTHTSGLKPGISRDPPWSGYEKGIELACATVPDEAPDQRLVYSDINFILLGEIIQRITGQALDRFAQDQVFAPLQMKDTHYRPNTNLSARIAATDRDEMGVMLRGVVHDPTARRMGGVAGHAGVFSTSADIARFARCLLNGGKLDGYRLLKPETLALMIRVHTPPQLEGKRALGWDVDTRFSRPRGGFPIGTSFGHTGFTGACLWLDPASETFFVFLSNRLHETDPKSDSRRLYEILGWHASRAAGYAGFMPSPE